MYKELLDPMELARKVTRNTGIDSLGTEPSVVKLVDDITKIATTLDCGAEVRLGGSLARGKPCIRFVDSTMHVLSDVDLNVICDKNDCSTCIPKLDSLGVDLHFLPPKVYANMGLLAADCSAGLPFEGREVTIHTISEREGFEHFMFCCFETSSSYSSISSSVDGDPQKLCRVNRLVNYFIRSIEEGNASGIGFVDISDLEEIRNRNDLWRSGEDVVILPRDVWAVAVSAGRLFSNPIFQQRYFIESSHMLTREYLRYLGNLAITFLANALWDSEIFVRTGVPDFGMSWDKLVTRDSNLSASTNWETFFRERFSAFKGVLFDFKAGRS